MRRRTNILLTVGIIVLFRASATRSQEEQWLQYNWDREAGEAIGNVMRVNLDFMADKPPGVRLPELKGQKPQFMKWSTPTVESGRLWIAMDCSTGYGQYDLLYIDSNGDGHLDDETAVKTYSTETSVSFFGPVKVLFQGEDGPVVYHLNFKYYQTNDTLYAFSGGWYEGDITVEGVKKRCTLIDHNGNGTFNDVFKYPNPSDRIRIAEADGRSSRFVGEYIEIDGALYRPEIARDGAYIKLSKAENVKFGNVRVPESIKEFSAGGENGLFVCKPENGLASLPLGRYGVQRWVMERKDDRGVPWKMQGTQLFNKSLFNVTAGKEAVLSIGEPIVYTLEVTKKGSGLYFNQSMKGRFGDQIELTRNGAKPGAPILRIKSNDGSYDRTFNFEYG